GIALSSQQFIHSTEKSWRHFFPARDCLKFILWQDETLVLIRMYLYQFCRHLFCFPRHSSFPSLKTSCVEGSVSPVYPQRSSVRKRKRTHWHTVPSVLTDGVRAAPGKFEAERCAPKP